MRARVMLLALIVAAGPAGVSAQDHGPTPQKPATAVKARGQAPAEKAGPSVKEAHPASKDAHAPGADAQVAPKDAPAPAPNAQAVSKDAHGDAAAAAHDDEHAAPQDKPKPKPRVSSVAAPLAHSAAPAAESHGETGQPRTGYVATGSKKPVAGSNGKAKPMVSAGAVPDLVSKKVDAAHDAHGAPASPDHAPAAAAHAPEAAGPESHAASAAPSPAAPAAAADAKKPAKLSDVHERLTGVLAGFHAEAHVTGGVDRGDHGADAAPKPAQGSSGGRRRADGAPARVSVQWPGPRWTLAWPGPPRLSLTWPEAAPKAATPRATNPY